jgi:hypothetical protein
MNISDIIGLRLDSPNMNALTSSVGETPAFEDDVELSRTYAIYKKAGISINADLASNRVTTIFLKSAFEAVLPGVLPYGLRFSSSREDVRRAVGRAPDASNDSLRFDTWEELTHKLRVEYTENFATIKMVVFMAS